MSRASSESGMHDGRQDIAYATQALAARLPAELKVLARLAYNYWWSWAPGGPALFADIDPERWRRGGRNPVRLLEEVTPARLAELASDADFSARTIELDRALQHELSQSAVTNEAQGQFEAFICAEFGIHSSLPFYAGGLGVLAGDYLKEASDRRQPVIGVGLFYAQGSFHQRMDASGWQHEYWLATDSDRLPAVLVTGAGGRPVTVGVPLWDREVQVRIWRVDVGRTPLYLLDTDCPENTASDRWVTARLYVSDRRLRLAQYVVLGAGTIRALSAMGVRPTRLHLNEGHAVFAAVETLLDGVVAGSDLGAAVDELKRRVSFTTHTPVAAGNESFPADEVAAAYPALVASSGAPWDELLALARVHPDDPNEPFGLTPLALRLAGRTNAVSRRHGAVSRGIWHDLWPGIPESEIPISVVTNGVHFPTWLAPEMRLLLDQYVPGWNTPGLDPETWSAIDTIPDAALWSVRCQLRSKLVASVRYRSVLERLGRGEAPAYAESPGLLWDDASLTIGFARRIATYKRLYLLTTRPDRAVRLLQGPPALQIVIAGRAHPQDEAAKRTVQSVFALNDIPGVGGRGVFLEEHDMALAAELVQGCDLWINLPRPPQEASGTSGMKSAINGGLQLSVLDGWWAEAFDGENGWGLESDGAESPEAQDSRDADHLFDLLEHEIVPLYYQRDASGIPQGWVRKMRASLKTVGAGFSATRMLHDYGELAAWPASPDKGVI